jgi:hypothetical protein
MMTREALLFRVKCTVALTAVLVLTSFMPRHSQEIDRVTTCVQGCSHAGPAAILLLPPDSSSGKS